MKAPRALKVGSLFLALTCALASSSTASAANGTVSVKFRISAGRHYCYETEGTLRCEYVGGPESCPMGGVTFLWGGQWINFGSWLWIWTGFSPLATLVPEKTIEIKSVCNHGYCQYYANTYCDYPNPSQTPSSFSVPAGGVQGSFYLGCPNQTFPPSAPPVATSPIWSLPSGGTGMIDFGTRLGSGFSQAADALSVWSAWAPRCGLPSP